MVRLGDVVRIEASSQKTVGDRFWLLNLDMVEQQTGNIIDYNYVGKGALNGSIIQFDTGCVLYSKLRPNLNKVVIPSQDGFATSEMLPLRPNTKLLTREYLTVFLRSDSFVTWAVSKTAGAKMPRLGSKELLGKEIPLPSISEQIRIAGQFAKVDELISLRKEQLAKLDQLVKSRFVELFGDSIDNPLGWKVANFQDVVCFQEGPGVRNWQFKDSGIKLINIRNLVDDNLVLENTNNYLSEQEIEEKYKHFLLDVGDYVMASSGVTWGKIAEVFEEHLPLCLNTSIIRLRPYDEKTISKKYLFHYIKGDAFRMQISKLITGSAQPNFGPTHLKKISILVPPVELQNQFAAFIEQTDKSKFDIQKSLEKLEMLKKSLMQKYFG